MSEPQSLSGFQSKTLAFMIWRWKILVHSFGLSTSFPHSSTLPNEIFTSTSPFFIVFVIESAIKKPVIQILNRGDKAWLMRHSPMLFGLLSSIHHKAQRIAYSSALKTELPFVISLSIQADPHTIPTLCLDKDLLLKPSHYHPVLVKKKNQHCPTWEDIRHSASQNT